MAFVRWLLMACLCLMEGLTHSLACPHLCTCDERVQIMTCSDVEISVVYLQNLILPLTVKEIYMSNNKLAHISLEILRPFRHATKLQISMNLIQSIPPNTFAEFENLTTLTLNNNQIRDIHKDAFSGLSNLLYLKLSENKVANLYEGMFDHLSSVTSIRLMENKIQTIPNKVFTNLQSLRDLFVDHNKISDLDGEAFANMTMSRLSLSYNRIKRIPTSAFHNFQIKFKIMLYYNPLECTCEDVMSYATGFQHLGNNIWGHCQTPHKLKGQSILLAYTKTECTMCDLNLCKNKGSCQGNKTHFNCMCLDQFKGLMCERNICKPEIRYIKKMVEFPTTHVLKYVDNAPEKQNTTAFATRNEELETKLMILYAICSLELIIILCFVGLLIVGKYQDWRLMKKYNKQKSPHILEKFRHHVDNDIPGKGYISISELIPYSY